MVLDEKETPKQEKETGRVEAFSDGVFAVAVTLLVFNVTVPVIQKTDSLGAALGGQWTTYVAYVISFFSVLLVWATHHRIFKYIQKANHTFLLLNGLVLMWVSLLPFPTSLLAKYIQGSLEQQRTAVLVYSGLSVLISLSITSVWWYASHNYRLLDKNTELRFIQITRRQLMLGSSLYALSFVLAFVNPYVSIAIFILLILFFTLSGGVQG